METQQENIERRSARAVANLLPHEKCQLERAAREAGRSLSGHLRYVALRSLRVAHVKPEEHQGAR